MINVPGLNITGLLGKGGTASVAKAFSSRLNKEVAVKYPLLDSHESIDQFIKLAKREHQLAGILRFPGIVNILKHSEQPAYLLLELCPGQSLDKLVKIDDPLMLMVIISAIAANLEFLRLNEIIHCDLKPHNIFLPSDFPFYESGELFFTKISDFSLGRFVSEPESARAGHGTVGYAAPEASTQGKSSYKSDLFALGVIGYQLGSGKHPFSDGETDPLRIESRIQEDSPAPLNKIRNDLPKGFINLVESLISKDENKRPETGWEVCQSLAGCGCKYPFEKVISPTFLLRTHKDFDKFVAQFLQINDKQRKQLIDYTDSKPDFLRLLLSANFKRGNLGYSQGRFSFGSNVYWPSILRRRPLVYFSKVNLKQKLEIVESAINCRQKTAADVPPGTSALFPHLLSPGLVKRAAAKFAQQYESEENFAKAAKLYLQAGNLDEAIKCAERATAEIKDANQRAEEIHLINHIVEYAGFLGKRFDTRRILMTKGDLQRTGGDLDSALETYDRIIELYSNHPPDKLLAEIYRDLGDIYRTKQKFDLGIKVLNRALEIYSSLKDELEESRTLNAIGGIYRIATDLPNALKFMRKALDIQKRLGAVSDAASSVNSMAIIYGTKGKLKRAINLLTISLKMKRTLGDQSEIARTLNNLGYAQQLYGNFIEAQHFLKESLEINRRIGSKFEQLNNLWNLSEIMWKRGHLMEATLYIKDGLELAESLNIKPPQVYFTKGLGDIHRRMCRFSDAEGCYERATTMAMEIDDKLLKTRLLISSSELRHELGDSKTVIILAEQALQGSVSSKARIEELWALMILVRILGKMEHLNRAKSIIEELKLNREKLLLEFEYLQFLLGIDAKSDLKRAYEFAESKLNLLRDDIEFPRLLNTAAEIEISCGNKPKGAELLAESRRLAHSKNLVSEEITSYILIGKMAFNESDYEMAFGNYKAALQLCKQAVTTITKDEDKQLFMKKPKIVFLANQIRQLNEKIGSKQKAGV